MLVVHNSAHQVALSAIQALLLRAQPARCDPFVPRKHRLSGMQRGQVLRAIREAAPEPEQPSTFGEDTESGPVGGGVLVEPERLP